MTLQSVFYATRRQFSEVYQMKWFFASTLDFYITHAKTQHNRLSHPYKYKLAPPVMCSKKLSVSH